MISLRRLRKLDWPVLVAVLALIAFGWPYMRSASYRSGPEGQGYTTSSPDKQILWIAAGTAAAILLLLPAYRTLAEGSLALYLGGIALLLGVLVLARPINGARSWFDLPGGFRFQPAELAKITTVLFLARYLAVEQQARRLSRVLAALAIAAFPAALIAAQPDLGSALMLIPAAAAMIFVAGARLKHLLLIGGIAIALLPALWLGMNSTQRGRVTTWLAQSRPLTRAERVGQFHHLIQSKIAVGAGGWTGKGLDRGTQNKLNYLGFRNTDFIFAVICEEAGFLGANVIILLFLLLGGSALSIAQRAREPVGRLLAVGIAALLLAQAFVNIAMTLGLLPIVGITLPFVSYGGSSTVCYLLAISLLINVGLRRPDITFAREEFTDIARQ